jgi:hypothetical protein
MSLLLRLFLLLRLKYRIWRVRGLLRRIDHWEANIAPQIVRARSMALDSPQATEILATLLAMERAMRVQKARMEQTMANLTGIRDFIAHPPSPPVYHKLVEVTYEEFDKAISEFNERVKAMQRTFSSTK